MVPIGHVSTGPVRSCGVIVITLLITSLQPTLEAITRTLVTAVTEDRVAVVVFVAMMVELAKPSVLFCQVKVPELVPEAVNVTLPPGHTVVALAEIVPGEGAASTFTVRVVLRAQVPVPTV